MTQATCSTCQRPTGDQAYLCTTCATTLRRRLIDVIQLNAHGALHVAYIRAARIGVQVGGKSAETSLPYNDRARKAAWNLHHALDQWSQLVTTQRGTTPPAPLTATALATWLLMHVEWLRHRPEAPPIYDQILHAVDQIEHVVDRPADRWYAGPCDAPTTQPNGADTTCTADLYARPGATQVTCPTCNTTWDVAERRTWLLHVAQDQLAHAELIGRALSALGLAVTPSMIRGYVHRGRIISHGTDRAGRPLYRVGDVLDAVSEAATTKTKKKAT